MVVVKGENDSQECCGKKIKSVNIPGASRPETFKLGASRPANALNVEELEPVESPNQSSSV